MNARTTLSQLLFDGSYIVALQASKTYLKFYQNSKEKTDQEVKEMVINAYGNVLLAEESILILEKKPVDRLPQLAKNNTLNFNLSDAQQHALNEITDCFTKKDVKITGIIHAGSFTDTDFVRDMERWAKNFEDVIFDISDTIFVASEFIKKDILKKRIVSEQKLVVTGLPLDDYGLNLYKDVQVKENTVIFNGRLCDEKQPWLFDELERKVKAKLGNEILFIKTQEQNLNKKQYYRVFLESYFLHRLAMYSTK